MRIYLARHAETTWNLIGRYQGRRESALSALGVRQSFALAEALSAADPAPARIITSPLQRTRATAAFVADRLNVPIETDESLIEIAHGTWEGRIREEIASNDPERYRAWRERPAEVDFEDGESLRDCVERWRLFRANLRVTAPTLIVTHDAIVRVALLNVLGRTLEDFWKVRVENAAYAIIEAGDDDWTLESENVNAHLADLRATLERQAL